ncbi:MAG: AAA family ATPase [Clostridia bacterium]|nr:AAA family ATPase [Clostridia bacterium]
MKKRDRFILIIKILVTILLVVGLFTLLICALLKQFASYGGSDFLPKLETGLKFLFLGLALILPIILITILIITSTGNHKNDMVTFEYLDVDFREERRKLKSREDINYVGEAQFRKHPELAPKTLIAGGTPTRATSVAVGAQSETEEGEEEGGSRFYMLTEIDKYYEKYIPPEYDNDLNLKEICEEFRNYSAGALKLYYDIEDIRRFIGGLAVTKLIILQGMSGTGKTSLAYAFGEFLDNKTVVVPIQPMWKERTDLVGYYNEFTRKFNETTLLYKMYEADYNDEIYITVLDEMNIARVEYYFAEFLSLLEIPNVDGRNLDVVADKREDDPKLLQSNGKLRLPTNMWFIGTANNDDSTFAISDKVYDRAMVLNLDKKAIPFEVKEYGQKKISAKRLEELFKRAQREFDLTDRNLRRIKKLDEYMIKTFHITFGNRIMKQIRSYVPVLVACGGTELEALDDILARKVFRKLESKNPVYVKQMADGTCAYLDELFGENKLPLCKEQIRLIEQNV